MNPSVAPTIFIMAISSLRSKVVSLMVLDIINSDTTSKTTINVMHTTAAI